MINVASEGMGGASQTLRCQDVSSERGMSGQSKSPTPSAGSIYIYTYTYALV